MTYVEEGNYKTRNAAITSICTLLRITTKLEFFDDLLSKIISMSFSPKSYHRINFIQFLKTGINYFSNSLYNNQFVKLYIKLLLDKNPIISQKAIDLSPQIALKLKSQYKESRESIIKSIEMSQIDLTIKTKALNAIHNLDDSYIPNLIYLEDESEKKLLEHEQSLQVSIKPINVIMN